MTRTCYATLALALICVFFVAVNAEAGVNHAEYSLVKECLGCHPRAMPTHKPKWPKNMKEDWPLDYDGKMVCITCHDCISGICMLRKPKKDLCRVCHDCTQGMSCVIGTAHLGTQKAPLTFSQFCQTCHDGAAAKMAGGPGEHKVDVEYPSSSDFNYVRDRRVVIRDGKITCVSCHNPYISEGARLVKSNENSALCLSCHIK